MTQQIPVPSSAVTGTPLDGGAIQIAPDIAYLRLAIVNVVMVGTPGAPGWVLIDAGLPGMQARIRSAARARFGEHPPAAIVLTHAHFDHVGVLETLAETWDVPVYAHPLEHPYLNGRASYPPPDPSVGGGFMALMSPLFPRSPVQVGSRLHALREDGTSRRPGADENDSEGGSGAIDCLPGWRWLATPGHSAGHVSLWRAADRSLIAGDAFVTTAQESAYAAAVQEPELHGPPMYFTHDWDAAGRSVVRLAALAPERAVTGHGRAMQGAAFRAALSTLAQQFDTVAVPQHGRFVGNPQRADNGGAYRLRAE